MKLLAQPYLLTLNPSIEMSIVWIQAQKTTAWVEFGRTEELGTCIEAQCYEIKGLRSPMEDGTYGDTPDEHPEVSVWQYIAKIENLSPGEKIYYKCCYGNECTKTYFFHTAPAEGEDFCFTVISDLQALPGCDESVYKIGKFHPDFILFSGDATYDSWKFDQWFDNGGRENNSTGKRAFFACMQQENGARLMQYAPTFVCPGNHELNDRNCGAMEKCDWSIFMQMFRPLYPDMETGIKGTRWYSVNYGDMHIVSLSVNRAGFESGFYVWDSIEPDSPQIKWLENDLKQNHSKYKWVITHFHILSKAWDAKFHLCDPVVDAEGNVTYPNDYEGMLRNIFSQYGVNAVSYGHSHVYERYYEKGTHYIEAAYLSITFGKADAEPHPSGLLPVVEDNSRRSFMIAMRNEDGIFVTGYYADQEPKAFDEYQIADKNGNAVGPKMSYKSELHCHTADVSKCATFALEEMIEDYIKLDYDTIVITDHFNQLTFEGKEHLSWEEKCDFFVSGYKRAKEIAGDRINILLGMEYRNVYNVNDYLVYGVTEEFLKRYNKNDEDNIMRLRPEEFYNIVHENGMLIYQAHPFRDNMTIIDPSYVDGLETLNAHNRHESRNDIAGLWAKKYNLLECGGSDCHHKDGACRGGIVTDSEIKTNADLLKVLKGNFKLINPKK